MKKMENLNLKSNSPRNNRVPIRKRTKKIDPKPECILRMQGEYLKRLNPSDTFIQYQEKQLHRIYVNKPKFICSVVQFNRKFNVFLCFFRFFFSHRKVTRLH